MGAFAKSDDRRIQVTAMMSNMLRKPHTMAVQTYSGSKLHKVNSLTHYLPAVQPCNHAILTRPQLQRAFFDGQPKVWQTAWTLARNPLLPENATLSDLMEFFSVKANEADERIRQNNDNNPPSSNNHESRPNNNKRRHASRGSQQLSTKKHRNDDRRHTQPLQ